MSSLAASEVAASSSLENEIGKAVAEGKGWKEGEKEEYLKRVAEEDHPMFAEKLEDLDPDMVKAFQDLTYENETPLSLGEHFKQMGNDRFKRGKNNAMYYRHALQAYTEGLRNVRLGDRAQELDNLAVVLLSNRAAANLALKNYGSCRKDCDEALKLSPGNVKCLYRKAKAELLLRRHSLCKILLTMSRASGAEQETCRSALMVLRTLLSHLRKDTSPAANHDRNKDMWLVPMRRHERECFQLQCNSFRPTPYACPGGTLSIREALAVGVEGLEMDPSNRDLLSIKQECERALQLAEEAVAGRSREREERLEQLAAVWDACEASGIRLGPSAFEESNHEKRNAFLPHADDEGSVIWPVLLLYPQYGQSDVVQAFREGDIFAEHLALAFPEEGPPAPWDESFEYRCSELVVYLHLRPVEPSSSVFEWIKDFEKMEISKIEGDDGVRRSGELGRTAPSVPGGPERWARIHPGCTLSRALSCEDHVVAGATPTFLVFPRNAQTHSDFLKESRGRVIDLTP